MSVKLTTSRELARLSGVKMLCYGQSGSGKTTLATTFGCPTVIISAEAGLLSIAHADMPVIEVTSVDDVQDAYRFLTETDEGRAFEAVVIDSISELGEVLLSSEKQRTKDPRAAYGQTNEEMMRMLRAFRDLSGRHVLFLAKLEKVKDELTGAMLFGPSMPGQRLGQALPYLTDEVFAMRMEKGTEGELQRWLQTQPDFQWQAKDRSGRLDMYEPPNMAAIVEKILARES